jgi:hypothetical protein
LCSDFCHKLGDRGQNLQDGFEEAGIADVPQGTSEGLLSRRPCTMPQAHLQLVRLLQCSHTKEAAELTSEQSIPLMAGQMWVRAGIFCVITIPASVLSTWFGTLAGAEASRDLSSSLTDFVDGLCHPSPSPRNVPLIKAEWAVQGGVCGKQAHKDTTVNCVELSWGRRHVVRKASPHGKSRSGTPSTTPHVRNPALQGVMYRRTIYPHRVKNLRLSPPNVHYCQEPVVVALIDRDDYFVQSEYIEV